MAVQSLSPFAPSTFSYAERSRQEDLPCSRFVSCIMRTLCHHLTERNHMALIIVMPISIEVSRSEKIAADPIGDESRARIME
jgi:hypothetical protein